jgi:dihydrofolate reductase
MTDKHSLFQPEIILIAAIAASNRVIGQQGKLPWLVPQDSKRFQRLTTGHTIIMGRKTWEFDLEKCPLPHRWNIVVSSQADSHIRNDRPFELTFVSSLAEALQRSQQQQKVFIVGGASIYAQALTQAHTWELTLVEGDFDGDTFFPEYQHLIGTHYELVAKESYPGYQFETYYRKS